MKSGSSNDIESHRPGLFITFEGGEGVGKSTQISKFSSWLEEHGHKVHVTREPGGTPLAEKIRQEIISGNIANTRGKDIETALLYTARNSHLEEVIIPKLNEGYYVLCDRFHDSTHVYQGALGGVDEEFINDLDDLVIGDNNPDLTFLLDVPTSIAAERRKVREINSNVNLEYDQFESLDEEKHQLIRNAFLDRAKQNPERIIIINANQTATKVCEDIIKAYIDWVRV